MAQIFLNSNEKDIFTKSPSLLGPYRILFQVLLIGLLILSLSRLGLVVWQWAHYYGYAYCATDVVDAATGQ